MNLELELDQAEEESKKAFEVVKRLIKLGILISYSSSNFYGFLKSVPIHGVPRYGWEQNFIDVVKVNNDKTIVWAPDIKSPEKLLLTLVEKYRDSNNKVSELNIV